MERFLEKSLTHLNKSVLLLGPRQVGKSTFLRGLTPDLILNLADETLYLELQARPGRIHDMIAAAPRSTGARLLVLVDEIQRIPSLLNTLQALLDAHPEAYRFLISGSSARKLKRGQANLLPGRVLQYRMGGLSLLELNSAWDVERALSIGMLPEPYLATDVGLAQKLLETYSGVYLKEEIQVEAESLSLQGFSRFIFTAAEHSGTILDFSKLAAKSKVSRSSCKRYYEILEDSLVVYRVPPYQPTEGTLSVKHSRFYFFDPGVWNGFLRNFRPSVDRKGRLFEHLVIAQIYNTAFALDRSIELLWYRNTNGVEIDFILRFPDTEQLIPIEVKSGEFHESDLKGLHRFYDIEPKATEGFLVYPQMAQTLKHKRTWVTSLETAIQKIFQTTRPVLGCKDEA